MGIDIKSFEKEKRKKKKEKTRESKFTEVLNTEITLFKRKFPDKKKEQFYSELGILLSSGLDIKTAFDIITEEQSKKAHKKIFIQISEAIINGSSLSKAMEQNGNFTPYEYHSISIGEETGKINNVLNDLSSFFDNKIKQSKKVINALSYPALVLLTAIGAVYFMLNFMVPMFKDIFKQFDDDLPGITKAVIAASDFFQEYMWLFFLTLVFLIFFIMISRKKEWYRKYSSNILLKTPIIGKTVKMIYIERFFQSLTLLAAAKIPMIRTLELIGKMINFYPVEAALKTMITDVTNGVMLNESMQKFSFFNKRICALIKVAEEVNQIENISDKLRKQYSNELEHRISLMSSLLEPVMIIFIGVLVAVILISMYLPMFKMGTSVY